MINQLFIGWQHFKGYSLKLDETLTHNGVKCKTFNWGTIGSFVIHEVMIIMQLSIIDIKGNSIFDGLESLEKPDWEQRPHWNKIYVRRAGTRRSHWLNWLCNFIQSWLTLKRKFSWFYIFILKWRGGVSAERKANISILAKHQIGKDHAKFVWGTVPTGSRGKALRLWQWK